MFFHIRPFLIMIEKQVSKMVNKIKVDSLGTMPYIGSET